MLGGLVFRRSGPLSGMGEPERNHCLRYFHAAVVHVQGANRPDSTVEGDCSPSCPPKSS